MVLDHAWIVRHIPHQGSMCLLDQVETWDPLEIRCRATSHTDPQNPLRAHGRLGAACGLEYAAQAMAVHARLCAGPEAPADPVVGYLASVRELTLEVDRLDDISEVLDVRARRISGDDRLVIYSFSVQAGDRQLVHGRASVVLNIVPAGRVPA